MDIQHFCKNVTSDRRHLPPGSQLMIGDQLISGCAEKVGGSVFKSVKSDDEIQKDKAAASLYGFSDSILDTGESVFPIGTKLGAGDFVPELGFVTCDDGAEIIHQGYGGEMRAYAAGTKLNPGDVVINGSVIGPDGTEHIAPKSIDGPGFTAGSEGAAVSPAAVDGDGSDKDEYCTLQELAGSNPEGVTKFDDLLAELDFDLEIPELDMSWWVAIVEKISQINGIANKYLNSANKLIDKIIKEPENACALLPIVERILAEVQKVYAVIAKVQAVMSKLEKVVRKIKKVIKLLTRFVPPLNIVNAFLALLQVVNGIPILLAQAVKTLTNVTRILASVIAMLSKVLSQCAINRGSDAGLSKEECEEAGGIYVDRKIGDLGIYDGTMPKDDNLRSLLSPDSTLTDEDINEINNINDGQQISDALDQGLLDLNACYTSLQDLQEKENWV